MRRLRRLVAAAVPVTLLLLTCGFGAGSPLLPETTVIVTSAPAYDGLGALRGRERFPKGAQLLRVENGHAYPLVEGFATTADASVSFDGSAVLFAGRRDASDTWGIWEFALADRSVRKVVGGDSDVIRPLYLPGGRLTYARRTTRGFRIEASKLDGSGALPLTYMAANAIPDDVLADGRILFEAGFPLGTGVEQGAKPELFLVYSDGSGVESYRCDHGVARWGGKQLRSGDVVFTHGASLARFTSPLASEAHIATPAAYFGGAIAEADSGEWIVSARAAGERYALKLWRPGTPVLQAVLSRADEDLVEPVLLAPKTPPNRHPTALHKWDYANLLALDARQSRDGALKAAPKQVRLETLDAEGGARSIGTAPVESDGSFFVKAPADAPIRFALLNASGEVVRQEHGWFWIRKGEQRICVGCHVGPEHASENRVPQVLLHTTTPVDLTGGEHQAASGGR